MSNLGSVTDGMSGMVTTIINVITEYLPQIVITGISIAFTLITLSIIEALIENQKLRCYMNLFNK